MLEFSGVLFCEGISEIHYKDGLFYLTDHCGDHQIRRAMRPSTFFKCVAATAKVIDEFERSNSDAAVLVHLEH